MYLIATPLQLLIATLTQPFDLSSLSPVHLLPCQIPVTGPHPQWVEYLAAHPHLALGVSHVTLATRSYMSQAPHSRHTRPCTAISPLLIRLTRAQESDSPSFKPPDLTARLSLWRRDVRISQMAYNANWERIGALKICAGMYEAPHDQSFS